MRLPRRLVAPLMFAALWLLAPRARAVGSGLLTLGTPAWHERSQTGRHVDQINRRDCLDNASVEFSTTLSGVTEGVFELWAGSACADSINREMNKTCVKVTTGNIAGQSVTARVQDLVKAYGNTALNETPGTAATCDSGAAATHRELFFLVYNSGDLMSLLVATPTWPFDYDITAPAPPTSVTVAPGESSLVTKLDAPNESNLLNYHFYCAPADDTCSSSVLVAGEPPPDGTGCGQGTALGFDSGTTDTQLENGVNYAIAVASEDDQNNISVLSEIACAVPQEVTGFYEAYSDAGGQAGGGFCSFAPARRGVLPVGLALLLGTAALRRRRR